MAYPAVGAISVIQRSYLYSAFLSGRRSFCLPTPTGISHSLFSFGFSNLINFLVLVGLLR